VDEGVAMPERYIVKLFDKHGNPQKNTYSWRWQRSYGGVYDALWFAWSVLYGKHTQGSIWHAHVVGERTGTVYGSHTKGRGGQSRFMDDRATYEINRSGVYILNIHNVE
jgi:hypothetical protein